MARVRGKVRLGKSASRSRSGRRALALIPAEVLPGWGQCRYCPERERIVCEVGGVEILARSESDRLPGRVLEALEAAVTIVLEELGVSR